MIVLVPDLPIGLDDSGHAVFGRSSGAVRIPDEAWISLHSEGPATGQLDQGFPWFSLVPERVLSWYPNCTLHCMLLMQPSRY
jgi:hypothetical protein